MAEVWEAGDEILQRPVAVKILHNHLTEDPTFMARFQTEAIAAAQLHHPSIVAIYDTCHQDGLEAIIMELVRGRTLREYLDERGRISAAEAIQIGSDIAGALETAHRLGTVHRDIKPANILLANDGRVLVADFGIAKVCDHTDLTNTGVMLGSVKYLAPEQIEGHAVDARTDIYSLGVVLYEAVCGEPPFSGNSPAAMALVRLKQDPVPPRSVRPDLPTSLAALIEHCLERDPANRFESAKELRDAFNAVVSPPSINRTEVFDETVAQPFPDRDAEIPTEISVNQADQFRVIEGEAGINVGAILLIVLAAIGLSVAAMLIWTISPAHP